MTTLTCPCGRRLNVRGMPPGKSGHCPACGGPVRVPGVPAPAAVIDDEWSWEGSYGIEEAATPEETPPVLEQGSDEEYSFDSGAAPPPPRVAKTPAIPVGRRESLDPEPWFPPPLFFPARGMEGLAMVLVLGVTLWVMGTLVPEYCLGLMADAETLGTPQMGHLVMLITAMPVLFLSPLVLAYWFQYLARVLVNAAEGERNPPRPPDRDADGLLGGLGSWLAWLVLGLGVGLLPLAAGYSAEVRDSRVLLGVGLLGLPYALMALLLTFLHDEDLAARPWKVLWSLARVGPSFLILSLVAAGLLGSGAAAFRAALALRREHFWPYVGLSLPCWLVLVWLTIVTMHTLGSYQAARKDRLRWRRPRAWWETR